jgi:hypothetical protein
VGDARFRVAQRHGDEEEIREAALEADAAGTRSPSVLLFLAREALGDGMLDGELEIGEINQVARYAVRAQKIDPNRTEAYRILASVWTYASSPMPESHRVWLIDGFALFGRRDSYLAQELVEAFIKHGSPAIAAAVAKGHQEAPRTEPTEKFQELVAHLKELGYDIEPEAPQRQITLPTFEVVD